MIARRLMFTGVVSLCAIAGLLASPMALAAKSHGFSSSFGVFASAHGVAVDDSAGTSKGDVYVVDQGASGVERFTAAEAEHDEAGVALTGAPLLAPTGVAVDDSGSASAGDVYVADPGKGAVDRFSGATGKFLSAIDGSETPDVGVRGFEPVAVAADPANGEVFVADAHNGLVDVFSPGGVFVSQFAAGALGALTGIAVSDEGDVYVTAAGGEALELLAAGGYTSVLPVGVGVSAVSVDPVNGNVYLDEGSSIVELNAKGESLGSFGSGSLEGSEGLGVDSASGTVYASDGASAAIFPEGEAPSEPATGAMTGVGSSEATLHGDLVGGESGYYFAYNQGQICAGGGSTQPTAASGSVEVSTPLTGLAPATRYAVCLVATNAFGQTQGSATSFTTSAVPPTIEGESFSDIGSSSVTLDAEIDPNGTSTSYYWEYGPSAAYGSKTPEVSLGEGHSALPAPAHVEGLAASGEYHFRVVAVSAAGGCDVPYPVRWSARLARRSGV
jgi:DNA-binding beta-propeller fold protein YncE